MKQVQVFKKTLLSVAVVTALGGYGTFSFGQEASEQNTQSGDSGTTAKSADTTAGSGPDKTAKPADATAGNGAGETAEPADATAGNGAGETAEPADATAGNGAGETAEPADATAGNGAGETAEPADTTAGTGTDETAKPADTTAGNGAGETAKPAPTAPPPQVTITLPDFDLGNPEQTVTQQKLMEAAEDGAEAVTALFVEDDAPYGYVKLSELDLTKEGDDSAASVLDNLDMSETFTITGSGESRNLQFKHTTLEIAGKNNSASEIISIAHSPSPSPEPGSTAPLGNYVVSGSGTQLYHQKIGYQADAPAPFEKVKVTDGAVVKVKASDDGGVVHVRHLLVEKGGIIRGYNASEQAETNALTTITGADQGETGDTLTVTGDRSTVMADLVGMDGVTVSDGGVLYADEIGSTDARVSSLTLTGKATVSRFTDFPVPEAQGGDTGTIYVSDTVEITIGKDQAVIQDIDGFKTVTVNGGVLEGTLTPAAVTPPVEPPVATVTLTSGEYRGGVVNGVATINGNVHLKPTQTDLPSAEGANTTLKDVVFNHLVTVQAGGNPVIHKTYDSAGDKKAVTASQGMTLKSGGTLSFALDHGEDPTKRGQEHLAITGDLTAEGNNKIVGVFNAMNPQTSYDAKRALYEASMTEGVQAAETPFTVLTATSVVNPENITTASADPFFSLAGGFATDGTTYALAPSYNSNAMADLKKAGLSENDASVVHAAQVSAFTVPQPASQGLVSATTMTTGAQMDKAISDAGYKNVAEMEQWDPHNGAAMAAVTVQQKTTQSISRHLNSGRTGMATGDMFESQGFWGEYMYSDGDMKDKDDIRGYKNKISGITLGLDSLLNDQLTVGFAFTYGDVKTETNDAGRDVNSDTYMGTLYTGWTQDNFFFDTMFSYGAGKNDYKRKGLDTSYKAEADSKLWSARFVAGYNYPMNEWILQPQAEFNYINVTFDDFREKGSGNFAQKVKHSDFEVMELGAGAKLMADFELGNGMLKPEFTLMGYHDFKDKKAEVEGAYLTGNGRYVVTGSSREQNRFLAGLGVSYVMDNNLSFGLNYDYNWLGDYKAHGLVASVRYDF